MYKINEKNIQSDTFRISNFLILRSLWVGWMCQIVVVGLPPCLLGARRDVSRINVANSLLYRLLAQTSSSRSSYPNLIIRFPTLMFWYWGKNPMKKCWQIGVSWSAASVHWTSVFQPPVIGFSDWPLTIHLECFLC